MASKLKDAEKTLQSLRELLNSAYTSARTKEHVKAAIDSIELDIERARKPN